jgi:hypothetical protein
VPQEESSVRIFSVFEIMHDFTACPSSYKYRLMPCEMSGSRSQRLQFAESDASGLPHRKQCGTLFIETSFAAQVLQNGTFPEKSTLEQTAHLDSAGKRRNVQSLLTVRKSFQHS